MFLMRNKLFSFYFLCLFTLSVQAQNYEYLNVECLDKNGNAYLNPLVGGLNSPQFGRVDFDLDGVEDLVAFDRDGEIVLPFRYNGSDYIYRPEYRNTFPALKKWARFVDYNADGIKDIFCYNIEAPLDGVEVYTGRIIDSKLTFEKYTQTFGNFEIIYFRLPNGTNYFNLDISSADLPDIVDVDNDGDLDIITFQGDDPFVKFIKNTSIEDGKSLDSLDFVFEDNCWGKFRENGVNENIKLSESSSECAPAFKGESDDTKHNVHAGSSITLYDDEGDGDYEAIIGDLSNVHMNWLYNEKEGDEDFMTQQDTLFPFYDTPIDLYIFNAAFVEDVDQDGNNDLLVAPNFTGAIKNRDNVWYYRNAASDGQHDFQLQNTNFLGDEMFDFGSLTNPTTCDFNQDGKKDLIIGVFGDFVIGENPDSRLYLLENIGDDAEMAFQLIDEDYLGFNAYKSLFFNYAPSIGDLDNDGDDDLMVSTNTGELIYLENIAGEGQPYVFASPVFEYKNIDVGDNAKVQLIDLNRDGLLDIVIGERNQNADPNDDEKQGNLNYFQNIGTEGSPDFNPDEESMPNTPVLGHVVTKDETTIRGSATPYFYDTGDSLILFTGSESGRIKVYNNIIDNLYEDFTLFDDEVTALFTGKRSAICVDDLNNDGLLEFIVGNIRGGFSIFGSDLQQNGVVNNKDIEQYSLKIYPNPASEYIQLEYEDHFNEYVLKAISGEYIQNGVLNTGQSTISIETLPSGIYVLELIGSDVSVTKLISVMK